MPSGDAWPANISASEAIGSLGTVLILILYGVSFYTLFLFSGVFEVNANTSIWYPPAGLRLAVLLIFGWRFGLMVFLVEAICAFSTGILDAWGVVDISGPDLLRIASLVVAIAIQPACYALGAFLLESRHPPIESSVDPFMGILRFLFIVCLAAAASGILAAANLVMIGFLSWPEVRATIGGRWIGDVIGILTLTPVLLLMADYLARKSRQQSVEESVEERADGWAATIPRPIGMMWASGPALAADDAPALRALVEGAAVCLFVLGAFVAVGGHSDHTSHSSAAHWYPFLLPVIWLALRFGLPGAIIGTFCMNVAAALVAVSFGDVTSFQDVQIFMMTLCVTGLLMGSVVSELRKGKATLDLRVRSRTCELVEEINRRQRAEDAALHEKRRAESYLAIAQPAIIAVGLDARITLVNNSAIRLLGRQRADLLGRDWTDILVTQAEAEAERLRLRAIHRALIAEEPAEVPNFETRLRGRDDQIRVIDWRSALIRSGDGCVHGILCSGDDITERVAAEEKLRYLASHDPVTGLYNRTWLLDHFPRAVARARRHGGLLGILFIDLTGFKQINDGYGHAYGDCTLAATAARLKLCVRETDAITRLGGDEFVILLEDLREAAGAVRITENMLRTIAQPLRIDDTAVAVGASIGIALFPYDGKTAEELLNKADAAMYLAKRDQPHGYRLAPGAGGAWKLGMQASPIVFDAAPSMSKPETGR